MLSLEEAIVEKLRNDGPCCFDNVVAGLPNFGWGQIFVAVDCMARDGLLSLSPLGSSTYEVSLGSLLPYDLLLNQTHSTKQREPS